MILAPFFGILAFTNIAANPTLFIYVLGILFGVIGSILANLCMAAYEHSNWKGVGLTGLLLVLYIAYLLYIFSLFD